MNYKENKSIETKARDNRKKNNRISVSSNKRTTKVTKGGRRSSFSSLSLVKNIDKNMIAFARASSKDLPSARYKSLRKAEKKMKTYFSGPLRTIPKNIEKTYRGVTISLNQASPGTGIKAGSVLNDFFRFLEIKDVSAKIICSRRKRKNKFVIINTAFMALDELTKQKKDIK